MPDHPDFNRTRPTSSPHPMAAQPRRPSGHNPYKCPGRVQVAGALYAVQGVGTFASTILGIFIQAGRPQDPSFLDLCGCLFGSLLGVASFTAGMLILRGIVRDVLILGVVTLLVAVLYSASGVLTLVKADEVGGLPQPSRAGVLAAGYGYLTFAGICFFTAMLVLSARGRYRRWATVESGDTTVVLQAASSDVEECFPEVVCPECQKASPLAIWQGGLWCRKCAVWVVRPVSPPADPPDDEQHEGREQEPG